MKNLALRGVPQEEFDAIQRAAKKNKWELTVENAKGAVLMLPAWMFPGYVGYAGYVGKVLGKKALKTHDKDYPDNPLYVLDFEDGKDEFWLKVPTWPNFDGEEPNRVLTNPDVIVMRLGGK